MKQTYIYIMTSPSGTPYTGMTDDLKRRVYQHKRKLNEGAGGARAFAMYEHPDDEVGRINS